MSLNACQVSEKHVTGRTPEKQLKAEIEQLMKQGSRELTEEQEKIGLELAKEKEQTVIRAPPTPATDAAGQQ